MDVKKSIVDRRSVRRYGPWKVAKKTVKELLDAARLAPSGCNVQPTRCVIIDDEEVKDRLKSGGAFLQEFVYKAPLMMVLCGDPKDYSRMEGPRYQREDGTFPENRKMLEGVLEGLQKDRAIRDISIAGAYMTLRATELGLGTCCVGLMKRDALKTVLGIPGGWVIPYVITVGYPAETPKPRPRKKLKEIIFKATH